MIKKLAPFAIVSLSLNPFQMILAASEANKGLDVYIPAERASNEYAVTAAFLRPGGSNDYGVLVYPLNPTVAAPALSPSWQPQGIDNPNFNAAFTLNFRHVFADSGNDITFSWIRLRTRDKDTFWVNREPVVEEFAGPFWNIGPDAITTSTANGEMRNKYDVLSAELGKHIAFGPDLKTRLFIGLSSLWLKQRLEGDFTGVDPILDAYNFTISSKSKFNAGGLRFGMEGEYPTWCNIKAVGMLAGSLFVGSQQPITEATGSGSVLSNAGIPEDHQFIKHKSYIQTVPALDGKLGIKYSQNAYNKTFSIEAGYMTSIFLNVIQSYVPSTYAPATLGVVTGSFYLQSLMKTTESFSVDGPYATFSVKI